VEIGIYEDEGDEELLPSDDEEDDESYDYNEEMLENDFYDSKLDDVDEVIYFKDTLTNI